MFKNISKNKLARLGENLAKYHYQSLGYNLLGQNLKTPYGEIDLLFYKKEKIIIVEVKTRTSQKYGLPEDAISSQKINNIQNSWDWLQKKLKLNQFIPNIEICSLQINDKKARLKKFNL